jgi:enoyl-CoA hydratase/carnithine racemase
MKDAARDETASDIEVTRPAAGVVLITLHRPDARNALRTKMLREIAATALAAGIAVEVDEPESAISRALEIASVLAAKPALALREAKAAVLRAFESPLAEGLAADRQAFALLAASADRNEGIAAFLEKRPAHFTGK